MSQRARETDWRDSFLPIAGQRMLRTGGDSGHLFISKCLRDLETKIPAEMELHPDLEV